MRSVHVLVLLVAAVVAGAIMIPGVAAEEKSGAEIKTVVPGRMVCSEACKAKLDLANGVHKCAGCPGICNVAHTYCTKCAKKLGVCEVCGKKMGPGEKPAQVSEKELKTLVAGNNAFACDLYARLSAEAPMEGAKGNLFFSPYSISTALAMTYAGADGMTRYQMAETLHWLAEGWEEEMTPDGKRGGRTPIFLPWMDDRLHPAFKQLEASLSAPAGTAAKWPYELTVANALWGQQGYAFLAPFVETVMDNYGGGLNQVNFAGDVEEARKTINQWVEDRTKQRIKDLIPPRVLTPMVRLVLTNAIYFKGKWASPFDEKRTRDGRFTYAVPSTFRGEAKIVEVPMMKQKSRFRYLETDEAQILELRYSGDDVAMLVLLPRPSKVGGKPAPGVYHTEDLAALEKNLTLEKLSGWVSRLHQEQVEVHLPRFTLTSAFSLADALQAMGMVDAFDAGKADFSGMTGQEKLFISAVLHKAFVAVDEEGTEAAAATAVVAPGEEMPERPLVFRADHPFLLLIRHVKTGSILFMGRVMDPQ